MASAFSRFSQNHQFLIDILGLVLVGFVVHLCYLLFVTPSADEILAAANAVNKVPPRELSIIIKDGEQEICLILSLWCLWLWVFRYRFFQDEGHLLKTDFLDLEKLDSVDAGTLSNMRQTVHSLQEQIPDSNLLRGVETAIDELQSHGNYREATAAAHTHCDVHLEVLESRLNITQYILWAIPSVGFLGTVRGIGQALARADEAMQGDIFGVATNLGVAFNSTFVALFLSLFLMFISYVLQGREERLVTGFKDFVSSDLMPTLRGLNRAETLGTHTLTKPSVEQT